ncbi:thiamine phosphate synthase [Marinoscillum furvescens]|uniref:Thiamine-phosphate pyrophosphorylase n=1 Tax=Marinoscillum furvescens DSM 4134 TaxID=1122208 RepID=A0A3D9L802_MARFU|nr:thiamine phosphate synthase [Marinoscillum furvescens]REE01779.1 thiamine-phosphate pyrophosphorylase [Marinoscillum furvescens DSM 4134]
MKVIVITDERPVADELDTVLALLGQGAYLHVRKPGWSEGELSQYLEIIPKATRKRISIHGCGYLAETYGLGGIHLQSQQPLNGFGQWEGRLSKSFHTLEDIRSCQLKLDYALLSPIFDSLSKPGYASAFDKAALKAQLPDLRQKMPVYALGGVTPEHMAEVCELGFDGVAVLGALWQQPTTARRLAIYEELMAYV